MDMDTVIGGTLFVLCILSILSMPLVFTIQSRRKSKKNV